MDDQELAKLMSEILILAPKLLGFLAQLDPEYIEDARSDAYEVYEEVDWEEFTDEVRDELVYCCAMLELFSKKSSKINSVAKLIQQIDSIGRKE
jgi:hypothetical protein